VRPPEERTIGPELAGILIAWITIFAATAWRLATSRDREPVVWLAFGAVLGPIALALLLAAPPGRCRSCLTPTRGWLTVCAWCHQDVRVVPVQTRRLLAKMNATPIPVQRSGRLDHARPVDSSRPPRGRVAASRPSGFALPLVGGAVHRAAVRMSTAISRRRTTRTPAATTIAATTIAATTRPTIEARSVATATYIAGTTALEPGGRYVIEVGRARLRLLGPVDVDPSTVALDFNIAEMDASLTGGRLLISQHRDGSGAVLAFMAVAGMTPDGLASAIVGAARTAARS